MEIEICHRKLLLSLGVIVFLGLWTCFSLDSTSLSEYESGKSKFKEMEVYATNENYGKCWTNAVEVIKVGCKKFTEETHAKMALAYLNCFMEMQGRRGYNCPESAAVQMCTSKMSDSDRTNYATFFTYTHSICYFLQSQIWQEKTQRIVQHLSVSSEQVATQLEESSKLQQKVIERQNESLKNQEKILDKAHNLSKIINTSTDSIHEMLHDFQKVSAEQRNLINNLFDRVAQIQTLVTGEMSTIYSLVYYICAIFIAYLLTSANRTSGARLWLFGTMMVSMVIEWSFFYVFRNSESPETFQEQADSEVLQYHITWYWRKFTAVLGVFILVYKAFRYKDIQELNHQHLLDLGVQFSNFSKVLKEFVEKTPQKETNGSKEKQITLTESEATVLATPIEETGSITPTGSPVETGSHVITIPVEFIPDTPVSQKTNSHYESHVEPSRSKSQPSSSSRSTKSRSRSSREREMKALKASSPYKSKSELLESWTESGYYPSSYGADDKEGMLKSIHEDPLDDNNQALPLERSGDIDFPDDSTGISLKSANRYNLRERRKRTRTAPS